MRHAVPIGVACIGFAALLVTYGCGPGAGPTVGASVGAARVAIEWPRQPAARAIPPQTTAVVLTVTGAGLTTPSVTEFPRPSSATRIEKYLLFPTGPKSFSAVAKDAAGKVVASATTAATLSNSAPTTVELVLDTPRKRWQFSHLGTDSPEYAVDPTHYGVEEVAWQAEGFLDLSLPDYLIEGQYVGVGATMSGYVEQTDSWGNGHVASIDIADVSTSGGTTHDEQALGLLIAPQREDFSVSISAQAMPQSWDTGADTLWIRFYMYLSSTRVQTRAYYTLVQ